MSQFDFTDPGLVNVADQAYPFPPGGSQALPVPISVTGDAFVPPPLPPLSLSSPTPSFVEVETSPFVPVVFGGVSAPTVPTTQVQSQPPPNPPVAELLVTPSAGNFQVNNTTADISPFTISSLTAFDVGLPTERYQVFLGATTNLYTFGLDLTGLLAYFPNNLSQALPISAGPPPTTQVPNPTRQIAAWGTNWILVYALDSFGFMLGGTPAAPFSPLSQPAAGQKVNIAVVRQGAAEISQTNQPVTTVVNLAPAPQNATTIIGQSMVNLGNIPASSGVVAPFIGAGAAAPLLLGTFEVENQSLIGQGLPQNVFV